MISLPDPPGAPQPTTSLSREPRSRRGRVIEGDHGLDFGSSHLIRDVIRGDERPRLAKSRRSALKRDQVEACIGITMIRLPAPSSHAAYPHHDMTSAMILDYDEWRAAVADEGP